MPTEALDRLLYVVGYPLREGSDRRLLMSAYGLRLIEYPTKLFRETTVLAPREFGEINLAEKLELIDSVLSRVTVVPLPMYASRLLRWLKQLPILWRHVQTSDLVCVNIPDEAAFLAALICKVRRKRLLVQVIGDWGPAVLASGPPGIARRIKAAVGTLMASTTIRCAQLVFTQGRALFVKYRPDNPKAVQSDIVHTTLGDDTFFHGSKRAFHSPLRLVSVARLTRGKGLELLGMAIKILKEQGIQAEWWCVGSGPHGSELKAFVHREGLESAVKFFGFKTGESLLQLYRESDIFVLPSYTEGIPNAMLEAMAQCVPVVVTSVGGIPHIVRNGVDGLLIGPGSATAVAEAVAKLASNDKLVQFLRATAYETAREYRMTGLVETHIQMIEKTFGELPTMFKDPIQPSRVKQEIESVHAK